MAVLGGGAVSFEQGTPVGVRGWEVPNLRPREFYPRKSVRLTWESKSVYTEFVPTFRNFDFYLGGMLTYEHFKIASCGYFSSGPLCPALLRGWHSERPGRTLFGV